MSYNDGRGGYGGQQGYGQGGGYRGPPPGGYPDQRGGYPDQRGGGGYGGGQGGYGGQGGMQRNAGYVYRQASPEAVKARAERPSGRFDSIFKPGFDTWKPAAGQNWIRFLPPTWDSWDHYGLPVFVHGFVGPDQGSYLCLKKHLDQPCPLCMISWQLRQRGDEDAAREVGYSERFLYWLLDRNNPDPRPRLWNVSGQMDREIAALCYDIRTGTPLYIDQPDQGYDLIFQRVGQGKKGTRYIGHQIDRTPSPIHNDPNVQAGVLQYIMENPLPSVLLFRTPDYLDRAMMGTGAGAPPMDNRAGALLGQPGPGYPPQQGYGREQAPRYEDRGAPADTRGYPGPGYDPGTYQREPTPGYGYPQGFGREAAPRYEDPGTYDERGVHTSEYVDPNRGYPSGQYDQRGDIPYDPPGPQYDQRGGYQQDVRTGAPPPPPPGAVPPLPDRPPQDFRSRLPDRGPPPPHEPSPSQERERMNPAPMPREQMNQRQPIGGGPGGPPLNRPPLPPRPR